MTWAENKRNEKVCRCRPWLKEGRGDEEKQRVKGGCSAVPENLQGPTVGGWRWRRVTSGRWVAGWARGRGGWHSSLRRDGRRTRDIRVSLIASGVSKVLRAKPKFG
ncbi:hypothetical protein KM043_009625 [Ampulex compressa]|nr:hypothetical protein KM043_009625 [Ampulex compressa]